MLKIVSKTIKIKTPDKLKYFDINGPIINALKNAIPIATPTIAIDRVLLLSVVLSDKSAISAPDIAPAPCKALPKIRK